MEGQNREVWMENCWSLRPVEASNDKYMEANQDFFGGIPTFDESRSWRWQ